MGGDYYIAIFSPIFQGGKIYYRAIFPPIQVRGENDYIAIFPRGGDGYGEKWLYNTGRKKTTHRSSFCESNTSRNREECKIMEYVERKRPVEKLF